jgi:hypothetical protein
VLDDTLLLGSRVQIPGQQELLNEWNSGGYQHENYGHVRLGGWIRGVACRREVWITFWPPSLHARSSARAGIMVSFPG